MAYEIKMHDVLITLKHVDGEPYIKDVTGWCAWKAEQRWSPNQVASFLVYCESTNQHPEDAEKKIQAFERELRKAPIVWRTEHEA